ncbi:MAG: 4Fe-4S dicluster domain-containing protein [Nitrospinae bacterium]|nr:4Fe-4S dicluster domain-containing protein [Nitrospinota bacterium]
MNKKNLLVYLRRISQIFFLALFFYLLFQTEYRGEFSKDISTPIRITAPVKFFFEIDPLAAITTVIATHSLYKGLIWAVIIISGAILLGRFFCGWICPMGTLHQVFSTVSPAKKGAERAESNKGHPNQAIKYYILILFLFAAIFTSLQAGLLDPITFLYRSITVSILPGLNLLTLLITDTLYSFNNPYIKTAADTIYSSMHKHILSFKQPYFHFAWIIGILFITAILLNRKETRFWCRYICPMGALLGIFSRFSIFGMEKAHEKCTDCNKCLMDCQGADSPQGRTDWKSHECIMCFNCERACPEGAINFKFFPDRKSVSITPDLKRRWIALSGAAGLFIPFFGRSSAGFTANYNPKLIRPPGALEEKEFLARCIRCAECMKVCPTNALHPTLLEAGIEGIWTPILIPRIGYCEHTCILCSTVCPTGAIRSITEEDKIGSKNKKAIKIGTAFYDQGRCLPWAMATPCIVCEEHCPTSPKAIWLEDAEVPASDKKTVKVKRPYINPQLCIGCGICEKVCPVQDKPAVYVTSIGETRSRTNQILLQNTQYK